MPIANHVKSSFLWFQPLGMNDIGNYSYMKTRKITIWVGSIFLAAFLSFGCGGGGNVGEEDAPDISKAVTGKFPSTLVAMLQAYGFGWAKPTDPETLALIPEEYRGTDKDGKDKEVEWIKKWQLAHMDICLACEDFAPDLDKKVTFLDYNYFQAIRENTHFEEAQLRKKLIIDGKAGEWENFFLHFNTDTVVDADEICEYKTSWTGQPLVGYVNDNNDGGVGFPFDDIDKPTTWGLDVFADNGVLYIGMPEKFDGIKVDVSGSVGASEKGSLIFEYAAVIDPATMTSTDMTLPASRWAVNKWKKLDITDNFTKDVEIKFQPPSDWVWGTPYPAWLPGNSEVGSLLANGTGRYMIRVRVNTPFNKRPILEKITARAWVTLEDFNGKKAVKIPGWDPKNDTNKDNYISNFETKLASYNASASARFIHEGRVAQICTQGKGSSSSWGRYAPNLWNQDYINLRAEFTASRWKEAGITGNYNDNACLLLWGGFSRNPLSTEADAGPVILSGGTTTESNAKGFGTGSVRDPTMAYEYAKAFINLWSQIKKKTGSNWIGINTVAPYRFPLMKPFVESDTFDVILNETTIRAVSPYGENLGSDMYGLSKLWFIPALNKAGKKFVTLGYFNAAKDGLPNTKEGWKRRKEALLAVYYLWNIPGMTAFTPNFDSYIGAGNTDGTMYYKAGVPYEIASQPTQLLETDIGAPDKAPIGYPHVSYLGCAPFDKDIKYCNTVVGYSHDEELTLDGYGSIKTFPTDQYLLHSKYEGDEGIADYLKGAVTSNDIKLPADMVIARAYTNGMVLYRTSYRTLTDKDAFNDYTSSNKITVSLPDAYQRVLPDGTLADPGDTIELRGYEGAILKKTGDE